MLYDYGVGEPPLEGEFLRAVCRALDRNAVRGGNFAASAASDSYDSTLSKKPPKSARRKTAPQGVEEDHHADARR